MPAKSTPSPAPDPTAFETTDETTHGTGGSTPNLRYEGALRAAIGRVVLISVASLGEKDVKRLRDELHTATRHLKLGRLDIRLRDTDQGTKLALLIDPNRQPVTRTKK